MVLRVPQPDPATEWALQERGDEASIVRAGEAALGSPVLDRGVRCDTDNDMSTCRGGKLESPLFSCYTPQLFIFTQSALRPGYTALILKCHSCCACYTAVKQKLRLCNIFAVFSRDTRHLQEIDWL
ncbi:hypothetical protein NDU88_005453 [Pleurodeles waltl]|uniref:Uncharacterized protein n=1 Tax=Pleurodeles waltl TaxID=8319 RepID=A0AAV7MCY8_PLEWA|nr:hypothetical protein NDU88_005453 [Pleurodeles waltl]